MSLSSGGIYEYCSGCHTNKLFGEFHGYATCNACRKRDRLRKTKNNSNRTALEEIDPNLQRPNQQRRRGRPQLQVPDEPPRRAPPRRRRLPQRFQELEVATPPEVSHEPHSSALHELGDRIELFQSHTFVVDPQEPTIHNIQQLHNQLEEAARLERDQALRQGHSQLSQVHRQPPTRHNSERLSQQLTERRYPAFLSYMIDRDAFPEKHYLGSLGIECRHCGAMHFQAERTPGDPLSFHSCCATGQLRFPHHPIPEYLQDLLTNNNPDTAHFRQNIMAYNNAMAFTSVNAKKDTRLNGQQGIQSYVIKGELYHLQGPLRAAQHEVARFAQPYIYDADGATGQRFQAGNGQLKERILRLLHRMLEECRNPFIGIYKCAHEHLDSLPEGQFRILITPQMRLIIETGSDQRRTNLPTANEVAIVIPDEYGAPCFRDLVLAERLADGNENHWHHVHPSHPAYLPLAYPLFFPNGEPGWHWSLRRLESAVRAPEIPDTAIEENTTTRRRGNRQPGKRGHVTQQEWFRYHLFNRRGHTSAVKLGCKLLQKILVDAYASIDQQRLQWIRSHQNTIRADLYGGLQDLLRRQDGEDPNALEHGAGNRVILPSSFTGGDRWMSSLYQDSMAVARRFGKPALFVTFTANPNWREVTENLPFGIKPNDDPIMITRVFHLKQADLLRDLKSMFGRYLGSCWVVEYQKRGLPHCHILLFLNSNDLFTTQEKVNEIIAAELPNVREGNDTNSWRVRLFETISKHMIHGPCGILNPRSPCMKPDKRGNTVCSKGFPKELQAETVLSENGYPLYRRRELPREDPGDVPFRRVYFRQSGNNTPVRVDNRWVVPHCPYLSLKYDAHINVEVCSSIEAIRYMHKYVFKGEDRTTLELKDREDEIAQYLNGRYVGPHQAAYRILEYHFHGQDPPVYRLPLHLPDKQPVFFGENPSSQEMEEALEQSSSKLLAWFDYNRNHEDGRQYLYHEFPEHYVYNQDKDVRCWAPRQRGFAIGRVYYCSPNAGERFYLRMLLMRVPGATSFEHLRTVEGTVHSSFQAACIALGLVEDDNEWVSCFTEASHWASGTALRALFVSALQFNLSNANALWERFRPDICSDLLHRIRNRLNVPAEIETEHFDYGLYLIKRDLEIYGRSLADYCLSLPLHRWDDYDLPAVIATELDYDQHTEAVNHADTLTSLNEEQRAAYNAVTGAINSVPEQAHFYIQGAGGTGKTFLYRVLCHYYRSQGEIVLCVASSGIASLLLPGGTTAHSRFKIPVPCFEESHCAVPAQSHVANLLRRAKLCIWDEVPMQHKNHIAAVDRLLRDIRNNQHLFGGLPIVFGGDWAQTLPVVRRGNRAQQVNAGLRTAPCWPRLKLLFLTRNMRLGLDDVNRRWADFIQSMSYNPELHGRINLPQDIHSRYVSKQAFAEHVFPSNSLQRPDLHITNPNFYSQRAILSARNEDVNDFNESILRRLPTQPQRFYSVDTVVRDRRDAAEEHELSAEFLATLNPASIPASLITLKIGAPIMLLRNLHPLKGLCNGTRMVVTRLHRHCIEARILDGKFDGEHHCIPRIMLNSNDDDFPWVICRKQFPVRLCFAITINKSQGQSLQTVGIDLRSHCFSHGQLDVALSRVTDVRRLSVLFAKGGEQVTENVVYPEVLLRRNLLIQN